MRSLVTFVQYIYSGGLSFFTYLRIDSLMIERGRIEDHAYRLSLVYSAEEQQEMMKLFLA